MYTVMHKGVPIGCSTVAEAIRLATEIAASSDAAQPAPQPSTPPVETPAGDRVTKWTESAKAVIVLLMGAGAGGLGIEQVAGAAGLKGPKGSGPLLGAIVELLGDDVIDRIRTDEGKRWVLKPRGMKAAAKLGLLPQSETNRP